MRPRTRQPRPCLGDLRHNRPALGENAQWKIALPDVLSCATAGEPAPVPTAHVVEEENVGNSKNLAVRRKHRHRQRAAKEKLHLYLAGKMEAEALPEMARRYLVRRLRVTKRG
jgi:hypothetical protein